MTLVLSACLHEEATAGRFKAALNATDRLWFLHMIKLSQSALGALLALTMALSPASQTLAHVGPIIGTASWYGPGFHGRTTANGERYNMNAMTAAHKTLRFGTKVKVTNTTNGQSVVVRINDRGPFVGSRVIDLSRSAASAIDMIGPGTAKVTIEVLG
jgi:rare lipoprotein A